MADKGLPASSIFSNGSFFFARGLNPPPGGGSLRQTMIQASCPHSGPGRPAARASHHRPQTRPPAHRAPEPRPRIAPPFDVFLPLIGLHDRNHSPISNAGGGGIGGAKFGCENFYTRKTCQMLPPFLKDLYQIFPHPNFPRPNCLIHIFFTGRYLIEK